ncbi:short-chain collagen C4-like [Haliotis asinina]|uniref:short-chain collagen C4-like n=1 Tax=Haliotis asinina TaxID=109174 RepID=UPI0035317EC1
MATMRISTLTAFILLASLTTVSSVRFKGGAVYTRWGKTKCPSGAQLVYKGIAGGTHYSHKAGPANILCLPDNPEYGNYTPGFQTDGAIYGTEYETKEHSFSFKHLHNQDVPCAVCRSSTKTSVIMVPARLSCFPGWHVEYTGYLMGGHYNYAASEYLCVDGDAEADRSGHENKNGQLLYLVEGVCGSLPCPPYKNHWELTCTVCSK